MEGIVPELRRCDKRRLKRRANSTDDRKLAIRYLIVVNLAEGRSPSDTAKSLGISRSTVYRVAERYREFGEAGFNDIISKPFKQEDFEAKLHDVLSGKEVVSSFF